MIDQLKELANKFEAQSKEKKELAKTATSSECGSLYGEAIGFMRASTQTWILINKLTYPNA